MNRIFLPHSDSRERYQSYADLSHIFQGTNSDDLASVAARKPDLKNVLILGAGLGACLLPLSVFPSIEAVTVVDLVQYESPLLERGTFQFDLDNVVEDALTYCRQCRRQYDLIFVDLYTDEGYCEFLGSSEFYSLLASCLTDSGIIAINCSDIPGYLLPLSGATNSTAIAARLSRQLRYVSGICNRRNVTLFGSNHWADTLEPVQVSLEPLCEARMKLAVARAEAMQLLNMGNQEIEFHHQFENIAITAANRMSVMIGKFPQLPISRNESLSDLIDREQLRHPDVVRLLKGSGFFRSIMMDCIASASYDRFDLAQSCLNDLFSQIPENELVQIGPYTLQFLVSLHTFAINEGDRGTASATLLESLSHLD